MIKILLVSLVIASSAVYADDCKTGKAIMGAQYRVTTVDTTDKQASVTRLSLWRNHNQVAHEYPDAQITESWERVSNGTLKLSRYFDAYQRGIEYQPYDINNGKGETDWRQKFQLISDDLKDKMQLRSSTGKGCEKTEEYTLKLDARQLWLEWLPEQQLVKSYREETPHKTTTWKLDTIITDAEQIRRVFAERNDYQTTDYADIGDNESDPFLLKMINLGFVKHGSSGFYDADGHAMEGNHHH